MNKLINNFKNINFNNLSQYQYLFKNYKSNEWQKYIKFDQDNYNKNLVFRNKDFEIFVVCWSPYQKTILHDHASNGCIIKMLYGNLSETLFYNNNTKKKNILEKDTITYIDNDIGKHIMSNQTNKKAISLHLYSPPNYKVKKN